MNIKLSDQGNIKGANKKGVKCIVWDLDNTLWDGVLAEGDDVTLKSGIVDVIKGLDERGIVQSIASKNNHDDVINTLRHFELDEYFLYPQINWNPKSSSIKIIQEKLNIGIDTFVFLDDQPFERDEVAAIHPDVECLDDRAYLTLLEKGRIAHIKTSDDAKMRRIRYLEDMSRQGDEADFEGTPETFLAQLGMVFKISEATEACLLRAEELTVRTNQLNSTGVTYDIEQLNFYMNSPAHRLLVCELDDKYGSYGTIGLALIEIQDDADVIELLLMSCRTAARGVGSILLNYLMMQAKNRNNVLRANFRRTDRNRQMLVTYQLANFRQISKTKDNHILFENDLSIISTYPDYIQVISEL
ncbi:MAG: HAD-IIIC family phosphatase [Arenicella sp.]|nr:HAD-IIIC family phosphatase [Arenicella sp.]